ncbi:hypothetical protein [Jeotgalibaca caeni]|uniref:hypothetical protein n=1 Tax=Jeotgalibaca caeni TaxID=3028623 RepID=UPI00237EA4E4|nr:hypothetical protein [Jeotgalibaca caeni]MDE1549465.1 hypothetical protein [Jeotgalibaca caeni]
MSLTMILMPVSGLLFLGLVILNVFTWRQQPTPYQGSRTSFSAVIVNWLFYLFGVYLLLPTVIADFLFTFIWIILLLGAGFWTIREFRNNRCFALLLGTLTVFSTLFVILLHGIAQM